VARAAGQNLGAFLGGDADREMHTDYTVSLGSIEEMVAQAQWIVAQGFPVVKIKLGAGIEDLERVRWISVAVGPDVPLRLDANQGWSTSLAREILPQLAGYNIQHLEAPIPRRDFLDLPALRALSPVPLMADEACWDHEDAARLIRLGAVDRINVKLGKSGGLFKALKILRLAEAHVIPLQVGGFLESRLGFTAAAHLACCSSQVRFYDFDTPLMQASNPVSGGITYGRGGRVFLPQGMGLGATIDAGYLKACAVITVP
ncbi:MAG: enolase C-terminal domain-like protein, partial [Bacteroidota bacterium]